MDKPLFTSIHSASANQYYKMSGSLIQHSCPYLRKRNHIHKPYYKLQTENQIKAITRWKFVEHQVFHRHPVKCLLPCASEVRLWIIFQRKKGRKWRKLHLLTRQCVTDNCLGWILQVGFLTLYLVSLCQQKNGSFIWNMDNTEYMCLS